MSSSAPDEPHDSGQLDSASSRHPPAQWVEQIVAKWEVPLVAYTRSRLAGDWESARDVVQEAFAKLCRQLWPDIESKATAWLYKTCRNHAIDITRREGRIHMIHVGNHATTLDDRGTASPIERLELGEQLEQLRLHIEHLPDQQQEILRLRLQDGLSYKQIADVTGLTVTNVGYHLHAAIVSLRSQSIH